jgi:hypothetical protein
VTDVDTHERLPKARALAARNDISMAISDPCFELWLLLHFADRSAFLSSAEAQKALTTHMKDYKKNPACDQLIGRYEAARERALKLCAADGCDQDANPSTHMWTLIDALISSAGSAAPASFRLPL